MIAARFTVRGCVHGVGFRAHARAEALRLGLSGGACNRGDGSVEVTACGDDAALQAFERWLRHGPPLARVDDVVRETLDAADLPRGAFDIA